MTSSGWVLYGGELDDPPIDLPVGWYKEWMSENVYGWCWRGPIVGIAYAPFAVAEGSLLPIYLHLCTLDHEPSRDERLAIQEFFKDAIAPDGTKGLKLP